jgi:hypothetical protein
MKRTGDYVIKELLKKTFHDSWKRDAAKISRYAGDEDSDEKEYFAESFTLFFRNPESIPAPMRELIEYFLRIHK